MSLFPENSINHCKEILKKDILLYIIRHTKKQLRIEQRRNQGVDSVEESQNSIHEGKTCEKHINLCYGVIKNFMNLQNQITLQDN